MPFEHFRAHEYAVRTALETPEPPGEDEHTIRKTLIPAPFDQLLLVLLEERIQRRTILQIQLANDLL